MIMKTLALAGLTLSVSTNAALLDFGNFTTETVTNRDWLDLTETTNMSYNQVVSELQLGGQLAGWTVASFSDVNELFDNAGGDGVYPGPQPLVASTLFPLWGITNTSTNATWAHVADLSQSQDPAIVTSGFIFDADGTQFYTDNFSLSASVQSRIGTALYRTSNVPVPAAAWLFGSALIGLAGIKRKK